MRTFAEIVTLETPTKHLLNGLWFGPDEPKRLIVWVHGLGSNAFSNLKLSTPLVDKSKAVLTFNNRGHDIVASLNKIDKRRKKGVRLSKVAGMAHEEFRESADDIAGAVNLALKRGVKEIVLVGHSTGSQKSVYYLSKRGNQQKIKGVILASPLSDWSGAQKDTEPEKLQIAIKLAVKYVREGKGNELLPPDTWDHPLSAQRFLSLYTPDSVEEIFTYSQPMRKPALLRKVNIPTLVVLGAEDTYRDRPIKQIAKWFAKNLKAKQKKISVIPRASHSFNGDEEAFVSLVRNWLETLDGLTS